eukprot:scaffold1819_cov128-Skeletonema_menzelii.AAC.1
MLPMRKAEDPHPHTTMSALVDRNRHEKICAFPESRCNRTPRSRWFFGALMVVLLSFPWIRNVTSLLSEAQDDDDPATSKKPPHKHKRSVRFIPYPHKTLGSGTSLQCQWETRPIPIVNNTSEESFLDFTQQNAYTEGICIPNTLNETLHIFSTEDAIKCLSSKAQNRDIKLLFAGDSYMKQLTIGLADILLSKHIRDDEQMRNAVVRQEFLSTANHEMEKRRSEEENSTFPYVEYVGPMCYGKEPLNKTCREIINKLDGGNSSDYVWIIGSGVHIYRRQNQVVSATVQELNNFLETTDQIIFVSPPFYYPSKEFTDQLVRDQAEVYRGLLPNVAPENIAHPFLDVYELTRACTWKNCSYDRAHRSRFVNRWKAQMLLNTLCEVEMQ